MADKYIEISSGNLKEKEPVIASTGAGDSGKVIALDASGKLDDTFMPTGIGADIKLIECTENLSAGNFVNVYNATGTKCRKADATTAGKECDGFVISAVTSGQNATVYFEGINNQLTGLTEGAVYFLGTTAGAGVTTAPSASGNIVQKVGKAISATEISFEPSQPIEIA